MSETKRPTKIWVISIILWLVIVWTLVQMAGMFVIVKMFGSWESIFAFAAWESISVLVTLLLSILRIVSLGVLSYFFFQMQKKALLWVHITLSLFVISIVFSTISSLFSTGIDMNVMMRTLSLFDIIFGLARLFIVLLLWWGITHTIKNTSQDGQLVFQ